MSDRTTAVGAWTVDVVEGSPASVGALDVRRLLPRRARRAVGAWCFADVLGPAAVTATSGVDIGPHPHVGLHTVTWLVAGEVLHRDSLGSEQVVRPGQLNLMTAGAGVSHSEEATGTYRGVLHGVQLWVAQPDATRNGPPAFEHHAALPRVSVDGAAATVLVGELGGERSPARADTPLVGAEVRLSPGPARLPLRPSFEHAVVALDGPVSVDGADVPPGAMAYLPPGRHSVAVRAGEGVRAMLLGGEPFPEPLVMWWNFVGRSRAELAAAGRQWNAGDARFGAVASPLERIEAPSPSWPAVP